MKIIPILVTFVFGLFLLPMESSAAERPHIVLLMADDLGWGDVGYNGSRIATPNIDKLAGRGVRLAQFYAQPICSPTRGALLTGRYPMRLGLQCGVVRPWARHGLPLGERTLPEALADAGYRTAIVGKWHLGHFKHDLLPMQRGFHQQYGHYNGALDYFTHIRDGGHDWHRDDKPNYDKGYSTDLIGEHAVRIIAKHDKGKPLFLYVPFNAPHTPLQVPKKYTERYAEIKNERRRTYAAMVTCMDAAVGRITAALEEHKYPADQTLIFFCSDNGGIPQLGSNGELRAGKGTLYEGGVRVPAVAVWQGKLKAGAVVDEPLHVVDLCPTLLRLAGAKIQQAKPFDGKDAWPTIADGRPSPHEFILHNVSPFHGAIRMGDWKLIHNGHVGGNVTKASETEKWELFNILKDPSESVDVSRDHPEVLKRMKAKLRALATEAVKPNIPPNKPPADFKTPKIWGNLSPSKADKPNILLILVDDLKPALGCYGDANAKTPNIDALAARGMRFDLAYCNQAVCAPSRFTLMLGSHSTSTGLYGLGNNLRDLVPNAVTMPQHFEKHGYRTESLGKIFHIGHGNRGDPRSFSVPHFHDKVIEYLKPESTGGGKLTREEALFTNRKLGEIRSLSRGAAFESPVADDHEYADGRVALETIKRLRAGTERRKKDGTPFFIAAGFVRPHLPFSVPKKYWDLFEPAKLPMPKFEKLPHGAPAVAGKRGGEITAYMPVPVKGRMSDELKRKLIHGYYASTSFVDSQIGKVMAEFDRLGLADNTIVVLWGDHGFHLGDLGIWTKHTNYEQANRIPILICSPGVTKPNSSTRQLTESVDLFPTLAELAGLPAPNGPQPIDGVSLVPVLKNPNARVRDHAFHAYPKKKLGRAIRTERYRLVVWEGRGKSQAPAEYELYDYKNDPFETTNLAAKNPEIVAKLKKILATYRAPFVR